MNGSHGDQKDERKKAPEEDQKKPYQAPAWDEEEVLEKTALACTKTPQLCAPANS